MTEAIKAGDTISVDYTGKLEDGEVFDTSEGRNPLKFTVGAGMMIPGFDKAVVGMAKGESKTVTLAPEDAYGERNEEAMVDIDREQIPEDLPIEVGSHLQLSDPSGRPVPAVVAEITEEKVVMDINHFLAGKTLVFDITIAETGLTPDAPGGCGCGHHEGEDCNQGCGAQGCGDHEGGCDC